MVVAKTLLQKAALFHAWRQLFGTYVFLVDNTAGLKIRATVGVQGNERIQKFPEAIKWVLSRNYRIFI